MRENAFCPAARQAEASLFNAVTGGRMCSAAGCESPQQTVQRVCAYPPAQGLDETLARAETKAEAYEEKHGQAVQSVNVLRSSVWEMFNRIG